MDQQDVTAILHRARDGDQAALDELLPVVYDQLHRLASGLFSGQSSNHTLQPTALVNEAYLKLAGSSASRTWNDRRHFFAVAARAMRQILINHARDKGRLKRGGGQARARVTLSDVASDDELPESDLIALHEALGALETLNERQARIAELRFFAGLTVEEAADVLQVSPRTVKLDWKMAKSFLHDRLVETDRE